MVFAELAKADAGNAAARRLAIEGAEAALKEKAGGIPQYGQGWTDDMFMATAILARTGGDPDGERSRPRRAAADRLRRRLQQPDGIFNHAIDGPAAWGRGNGFAAFGLMEALTALPESHPSRARRSSRSTASRCAALASVAGARRDVARDHRSAGRLSRGDGDRDDRDRDGARHASRMARPFDRPWSSGRGAPSRRTSPKTAAWWTSAPARAPARPRATTWTARPSRPDDRGGAMALVAAMERLTR